MVVECVGWCSFFFYSFPVGFEETDYENEALLLFLLIFILGV